MKRAFAVGFALWGSTALFGTSGLLEDSRMTKVDSTESPSVGLQLKEELKALESPKLSPRIFEPGGAPTPFSFSVTGSVDLSDKNGFQTRFRVFSQDEETAGSLAPRTARLLLHLWDYNRARLRVDHKPQYGGRTVDVYLCLGGKPGGEQLFTQDLQVRSGQNPSVNVILVYDILGLTDKVEQVREIAHEYGHASLPSIDGFKVPEEWANGFLGEKLFLTWLNRDLGSKRLTSSEVLGVDPAALKTYLEREVNPLWKKASQNYPSASSVSGEEKSQMDQFLGMVLWMERILPPAVFARSIKAIGSTHAKDYPTAVVRSLAGEEAFTLEMPSELIGVPVWVPFGNCTVKGAATIKKLGRWVQIKASLSKLKIEPAA